MNRLARHALLVPLVVLAAGCGGGASSSSLPERIADVRVIDVAPRPLEVGITAVGTVEPENRVTVSAQEGGVVKALAVREGDRVRAGDPVARLDDREISAQLAEARALLAEARAAHERVESLEREGLVPRADGDAARAALEVARARAEALSTRLSFTRVDAPVAGVVTVRHVELGDTVAARAPVVELAAGRTVLRVPVSELHVVKLAVGHPARVRVDALPEAAVDARIGRIFPAADPASRLVTVELVLEDPPPSLRHGFLARADLVLERIPDAVMVPEPSVLRGSDVPTYVWVLDGEAARVRPVEVGLRQGGEARILSGLGPGERVVVEGMANLRDGGRVRIRPEAAPS
jgi:membrane fusion protein, multidrug efflux system